MALARGRAFLDTGNAEIIAVASRQRDHARAVAVTLGAPDAFDDYRRIASLDPDALLVEVPHRAQTEIVDWGLDVVPGILIGGPLAVNSTIAAAIEDKAAETGCLVEAGYNARYSVVWETARTTITSGVLGDPVLVQSVALYAASPTSWYYNQAVSGGMPLTHMAYGFINPVRWIFGPVKEVTASSNQLRHTDDGYVEQETCSANLRFQNGTIYAAVAGYVTPPNYPHTAYVHVLGTQGALEMRLTTPATHTVYLEHGVTETVFTDEPSSLQRQAQTFIDALEGNAQCLNPPSDAKIDVALAEAIVHATQHRQVSFE
jgi:predicted dehydrogenase